MLTFIGLGLFDKTDVSEKGLSRIRNADRVYLECYTSRLMGATREGLEQYYRRPVTPLYRSDVEQDPDAMLEEATTKDVVFLCAGDPMVSTTHADLRIRAASRGIPTAIIHAASIASAVCGLSGLQNYRFGKSCSLPFPQKNWFPTTPLDVILANLSQRLHTLVYLDIQDDRYMTVPEAVALLEEMAAARKEKIPLYVGIARAGSDEPVVRAGPGELVRACDFGPPLHILIVPAELHDMEREYLEMFAGL
ncbi:diphthine synthase [Methanoregula formicica]|uniref:Diphthine synthase n=1 Tax=Methanoregula formicica (strain DSM 22288 / NBRC 105244 / SMSP) TaxID=593750 RepID=L0HCV2_METFS|nr:diphthine synthase [Methanoregula formicica]AGB01845.1 diphthine synthase [Methanoregula formicica SMSP]